MAESGMGAEQILKALRDREAQEKGKYLADVEHVYEGFQRGTFSKREYLCDELSRFVEQIDLEKEEAPKPGRSLPFEEKSEEERFLLLNQILSPGSAPLGKWPGEEERKLWQQVDVNLAVRKGSGEAYDEVGKALAAGKKTKAETQELLKDLLAGNLVEKAGLLASYDKPDDAFESFDFYHGGEKNHAYAEYPAKWHRLKEDRINEYSMLLVSGEDAFLKEICRELTKDERAMEHLAADVSTKEERKEFFEKEIAPMVAAYRAANVSEERLPRYAKAREAFLAQKKVVEELQAELGTLQQDFLKNWKEEKLRTKNLKEAEAEIEHGKKDIQTAETAREPLLKDRNEIEADLEEVTKKLEETAAAAQAAKNDWTHNNDIVRTGFDRELELRNSVGGLAKLFSKKKYDAAMEQADQMQTEAIKAQEKASEAEKKMKELTAEYDELAGRETRIRSAREALMEKLAQINKTINGAKQVITRREEEKEQLNQALEAVKKEREGILERWSKETGEDQRTMLDIAFVEELFSGDAKLADKRRAEHPWLSGRYQKERETLFALAVEFQKAFIEASGCCMENLATLAQYWGAWKKDGENIVFHEADREETVPSLWQTLFLLVPLAEASLPTLAETFVDAKKPGLYGMLTVEGSEKLAPESVIGAMYRGRSALFL